ncbi:hypothetical protein SOCEGT47_009010 [Sorangium cellulosum]|jgi:hypothetical protein|uniref:PEGA domain-containing protein n=1 Tax=Sorangium cellulosum TaxID=56 RepID=A0A4V0NCU9_SORCE|nr:hypothetical protein [Sorangium cellulosum]AUX20432.1 hypothetical protein SOCEGT47_009010 [Sorangium cellulosum]
MHKNIRRAVASALAVALLASPAGAMAERPLDARDRLVAQAHAAVDEGRLADARDLWMAVWRLEGSQVAACNIGALSFRIGEMPAAVRWLSLCKEIMRPPATPEERALHESRLVDLARARQLVGELRVTAPPGARITVDDAPVEIARGEPVPVEPGRRVVRAALDGRTAEVEVDVPRGEARDVRLTFPARPSPAPPPPAPSRPSRALITGGLGLSATFTALGGVLLLGAERREEAVYAAARAAGPNGCFRLRWPMCQQAASARDDMRAFRDVGVAGLIAGGAVLAATLGYTFYPRGQADVRVTADGITVRGVF